MRDSLELFEKTLQDYAGCKNLQNHLMDLIENLYKDLECERSSAGNLQKQIHELTKHEDFGVTSKFVALKAEHAALKRKLTMLTNENDDLNIQMIAKSEETKHLLEEKEERLNTYYINQLKQRDEEIKQKEREVQGSKENLKQKEEELFNEIRATEVSSAMELDKIESGFRKQLADSNMKLKDSMDTCNILRSELMAVKEQFVEYKRSSNEKIAQLQRRLRESHSEPTCDKSFSSINVSVDDKNTKYQPLNISSKNLFSSDERPMNLKKPVVYRGSGKYAGDSCYVSMNELPPLMDLKNKTSAKNAKSVSKRRRLFNPDDLTYLNVDVPNQDT